MIEIKSSTTTRLGKRITIDSKDPALSLSLSPFRQAIKGGVALSTGQKEVYFNFQLGLRFLGVPFVVVNMIRAL